MDNQLEVQAILGADETLFEIETKDTKKRKRFDRGYRRFLLSEIYHELKASRSRSVRDIAQSIGVSKSVIQNISNGQQSDMKLSNFVSLANAFGYKVVLDNGKQKLEI